MLEYNSDTCIIYDGDRPICEMCKGTNQEDVKMILEAKSGWHLARDAANGLRVELDGDLGHEAAQLRQELDRLNQHAGAALEYLNLEDGAKDAFKELRRAFNLVNRFICEDCRVITSSTNFTCSECGGNNVKLAVVRELPATTIGG